MLRATVWFWTFACLLTLSLGCSASQVRGSGFSGSSDVQVVNGRHGMHDHPAVISAVHVRDALMESGFFLHDEVAAIDGAVSDYLAKLTPSQEVLIRKFGADYYMYVDSGSLEIRRYRDEVETGRASSMVPVTRAPPTQRAEGGNQAAPAQTAAPAKVATNNGTAPPRIWVFSVGISSYRDPSISLQYASRDAQAIDGFFGSAAGTAVPESRRILLTDAAATRGAILSGLTNLSKRAAPDDLLVIYLALHGLPDEGGDLYFLAHDTDPRQLIGSGLPQRDIEYTLARAPVKRVVMMIDACHAGGAGLGTLGGKRGLRLAETNRLLTQLAQARPGLAVLTASTATESSREGPEWGGGHGVFTHYLLEGLRGGASDQRSGLVTIRSLFDYVYERVSESTAGNQHPELKGVFDNSLPMSSGAR